MCGALDDSRLTDLTRFRPTPVPTLERLALRVVAQHIEDYEDIVLPCGVTGAALTDLAKAGRLREDTIGPLLRSWSSADELEDELGPRLAAAAGQSRGLAALAAQRLAFSRRAEAQKQAVLPAGTRTATASMAADAAR